MLEDAKESFQENENALHFYYNREERIAKAPANVQEYYRGGMKPVRGIKVFFTKQNRYVTFALIFFVGVFWVYTGFNKSRDYAKINDIDCQIQAFSYEEQIFVSIGCKKNKKSTRTAPAKIDAEIFFVDADNQLSYKTELGMIYEKGEEFLRTKVSDYEIVRVDAIINVDGIEKEISSTVKR